MATLGLYFNDRAATIGLLAECQLTVDRNIELNVRKHVSTVAVCLHLLFVALIFHTMPLVLL